METVSVKQLMSKIAYTATEDSLLEDVVHDMRVHKLSCMVVLDGDHKKPVGIITERDLVRILSQVLENHRAELVHVRHFMSFPPIAIEEDASLFDALVLTKARKIRHLPVVDRQGDLQGLLSYTDLAHAHLHIVETQRDVIEKAVEHETQLLKTANHQLQVANEQLKELSLEDALLEIGNRRAMEVDLAYTHNTAARYRRPYSVVLFDVDCFKQYNDHYGHGKGDTALKAVANLLSHSVRSADRLYRYGGEELLLILPETDASGAVILANRLIKALHAQAIEHCKSEYKVLTMSAGIGCLSFDGAHSSWRDVVHQADQYLYRAKREGRNRACWQTPEEAVALSESA